MRRIISLGLTALLVLFTFFGFNETAEAAKTEPDVIRVRLDSFGNRSQFTVAVQSGSYSVADNPFLTLQPGSDYTVKAENGQLKLYQGSTLLGSYASSFELIPAYYGTDNVIALNDKPYIGAIAFVLSGSYVKPINKLMLEDYLKGVVPSEMPASWSKEALKAQAIAARTYAVRCLKPDSYYDLVDTTASQVYGGYIWNKPEYSVSNAAVNETKGIVIEYNGSPATTEYSSSNGGWVEKSAYVPAIKYDEHDLWNSQGRPWADYPWSVTYKRVQIDPAQVEIAKAYYAQNDTASLNGWWNSIETATYTSRAAEKTMINGVKSFLANKYPGKDVRITGISDINMSFLSSTNGKRPASNSTVTMKVRFLSKDIKTGVYDYDTITVPQTAKVLKETEDLITFNLSQMRSSFGVSVIRSTYIDGLAKNSDSFVIRGRGYGHGRGMSQYGAKHRADAGQNYAKILDFYYPGTNRQNYSLPAQPISIGNVSNIPEPYNAAAGDLVISYRISRDAHTTVKIWDSAKRQIAVAADNIAQKAGNNSVRWSGSGVAEGNYYYTVEVVDGAGSKANVYGTFELINSETPSRGDDDRPAEPSPATQTGTVKVSSTLNVRSGAGTQYKVVGSLKNGAKVTVLGKSGSWYKIKYGSITGYVSGQYLVVSSSSSNSGSGSTTPAEPSPATQTGTVKVSSTLNVRSGAGTQYKIVGSLKNGAKVTVLGKSGSWYEIKYGSITGYVSGQYLTVA